MGVHNMFSTAVWASWCLFQTKCQKGFPAKFVTKRESVLLSEMEALARMGVYDMFSAAVWASWCIFPFIGNRVVKRFSCSVCDKTWECTAFRTRSRSPRQDGCIQHVFRSSVSKLVSFPFIGNRDVKRFSCSVCDKTWECTAFRSGSLCQDGCSAGPAEQGLW